MPKLLDQWLMPAGEASALALDVAVLAVQYLLLFALAAGMWPAVRARFGGTPWHRSSRIGG